MQEKLPYEFARAMTGINDILRRAQEILDSTKDPKLQHQYMTLIMQLWGTVMSMATDGGVIEQAMKMVKGLESQDTVKVKMSSAKGEEEEVLEDEDDFEDEEITVNNEEEILKEEEEELPKEQ